VPQACVGYELARCCDHQGFDLLLAADEPTINDAAVSFRGQKVLAEQHRKKAEPTSGK